MGSRPPCVTKGALTSRKRRKGKSSLFRKSKTLSCDSRLLTPRRIALFLHPQLWIFYTENLPPKLIFKKQSIFCHCCHHPILSHWLESELEQMALFCRIVFSKMLTSAGGRKHPHLLPCSPFALNIVLGILSGAVWQERKTQKISKEG